MCVKVDSSAERAHVHMTVATGVVGLGGDAVGHRGRAEVGRRPQTCVPR